MVTDNEPIEIRILGGFDAARGGRPLPVPTFKKARILIGLLAVGPANELVREDLATHLWPDAQLETAQSHLRQLLARMRRSAPEFACLVQNVGKRTIRLNWESCVVDAAEFRRLTVHAPERAVELYRGTLLPGLEDDWLDLPRLELEELFFRTVEQLVESADARTAVHLLRRALEADPYREAMQQRLFNAFAEAGDLSGMELAFRKFEALLHRDLNLRPSPETIDLCRRLRQASPTVRQPVAAKVAGRLPIPLTPLSGRDSAIAKVTELLDRERLVVLLGPGGIGKTRLAIGVGERGLELSDGEVWFIDLAAVIDAARLEPAIGHGLGIVEPADGDWIAVIAEHLARTSSLLVLDSCEHLATALAATAKAILSRNPNVRVLATSRVPLGLEGEQRYVVLPLEVPPEATLVDPTELALNYSAVGLFEARARNASPRFAITQENAADVVAVCRRIEGLPLAIEMAASRLGSLSVAQVLARLDDQLSFLRGRPTEALDRHRTMREVIEWSFGLLPDPAKTLLPRLATFKGGWSLEACEQVCAFKPLDGIAVLDALTALAEASLVERLDARFRLSEPVRQFAELLLVKSPERKSLCDRLVDYWIDELAGIEEAIYAAGPDTVAACYSNDLDNLRLALRHSIEGGPAARALPLAADASLVFACLQLDGEAAQWLRAALAVGGAWPPNERIAALQRACRFYRSTHGQLDREAAVQATRGVCAELIDLAAAQDDRSAAATGYTTLASILEPFTSEAEQAADEAAAAVDGSGNAQALHRLFHTQGLWLELTGDYDGARALFERSAQEARRAGDIGGAILSLQTESHLLRGILEFEAAHDRLKQVDLMLRDWHDTRAVALKDLRLAELALERGSYEDMREPLSAAKEFYVRTRSRFHEMLVDGLERYLSAHLGDSVAAAKGVGTIVERLVEGARKSRWAWWHAVGMELEALSYAMARSGFVEEGATVFGAARAARERDQARPYPSVLARWERLARDAKFDQCEKHVADGLALSPDAAVELAYRGEALLRGGRGRRLRIVGAGDSAE